MSSCSLLQRLGSYFGGTLEKPCSLPRSPCCSAHEQLCVQHVFPAMVSKSLRIWCLVVYFWWLNGLPGCKLRYIHIGIEFHSTPALICMARPGTRSSWFVTGGRKAKLCNRKSVPKSSPARLSAFISWYFCV